MGPSYSRPAVLSQQSPHNRALPPKRFAPGRRRKYPPFPRPRGPISGARIQKSSTPLRPRALSGLEGAKVAPDLENLPENAEFSSGTVAADHTFGETVRVAVRVEGRAGACPWPEVAMAIRRRWQYATGHRQGFAATIPYPIVRGQSVCSGSVENTRSHVETGKQSSQKPRDFRVQRRAFDRFEHSTLVEFSTEPFAVLCVFLLERGFHAARRAEEIARLGLARLWAGAAACRRLRIKRRRRR